MTEIPQDDRGRKPYTTRDGMEDFCIFGGIAILSLGVMSFDLRTGVCAGGALLLALGLWCASR